MVPVAVTLDRVRRLVEPRVIAAGFALSEEAHDEDSGAVWELEYRAMLGGRLLLFDLCKPLGAGTLTAELWSPDHLRAADAGDVADAVAIRRRVWSTTSDDPEVLARDIAEAIGAWLTALDGPEALA